MTPQVMPRSCSRPEALDILIAALVLYHRSGWAAPGPMKEGRAVHLSERVHAYLDWYRLSQKPWPTAAHLSAATDVMIEFRPSDGREKRTASPWVLDEEFPRLFYLTERCLAALPRAFSAWPSDNGLASTASAEDRSWRA